NEAPEHRGVHGSTGIADVQSPKVGCLLNLSCIFEITGNDPRGVERGQCESKRASLALFTLHLDLAEVEPSQLLDDAEPQPKSFRARYLRFSNLLEAIEYDLQFLGA